MSHSCAFEALRMLIVNHSSHRTLKPYLEKYGLAAEVIPLESFMHAVHFEGECVFSHSRMEASSTTTQSDNLFVKKVDTFPSIVMIKIYVDVS